MGKSLKDATRIPLLVVMLANFAVLYTTIKTDAVFGGDWPSLARDWAAYLPAGLGLIFTGILNAQLSDDTKARLVFWRWQNPLPASEAFSRHANSDPRIDLEAIKRVHGPLPADPKQQNALWYRMYRSVGDEPAVSQVHRQYLFTRDYACFAFLLLIAFGAIGLFQIPSPLTAMAYLAFLIAQYLVVRQAAVHHGRRFVTTVLAIKGATA